MRAPSLYRGTIALQVEELEVALAQRNTSPFMSCGVSYFYLYIKLLGWIG